MDLHFQSDKVEFYEPKRLQPFTCETMREMIVPDSRPDIARIVSVRGQVCLTSWDLSQDGRISVSGTVETYVLYIPEQGTGPIVFHFQLPFQSCQDGLGNEDWSHLDIQPQLRSLDARILNPRKILTRADILLQPTACRHVVLELNTDVSDDDHSLQLQLQDCEAKVIEDIREKDFVFTEEIIPPSGRPQIDELLTAEADILQCGSKLIGNKLVAKGTINAVLLYRDDAGGISEYSQELPFSQVLDGTALSEDMEHTASCRLMGCIVHDEDTRDSGAITLDIHLGVRVTSWNTRHLVYISDLYSTAGMVECETKPLSINSSISPHICKGNVRELLETGTPVKSVISTDIRCLETSCSADTADISCWAKVLYTDENNALCSTDKNFCVHLPSDLTAEAHLIDIRCTHGGVSASIMPEGVELRCAVECCFQTAEKSRILTISAGKYSPRDASAPLQPSVVLCRRSEGQTLWNLSKTYQSTCQAILDANEAKTDEDLEKGSLLLVPKVR